VTDQDAVTAVLPGFDVRGQVALVTGAARGLGRAIALALAAAGAQAASLITGETVLVDGGWTAR
jgi:NADP-dependent 3-hydroxy acid dehydrogenase YdfG